MENTTQLTIADLESIRQIIDAACTRGAFRAEEMRPVGEVYDKLSGFLASVAAQQNTQEPPQAPPQGDQNA
jgi:hypothetical protein